MRTLVFQILFAVKFPFAKVKVTEKATIVLLQRNVCAKMWQVVKINTVMPLVERVFLKLTLLLMAQYVYRQELMVNAILKVYSEKVYS